MARSWYAYDGIGDPSLTDSWTIVIIITNCRNGRRLCVVYAIFVTGSTHPATISANLQTYMAAGMATGNAQPQLPIVAKKYLYLLP